MSANSIAIIDYGMGNLHSVASALAHVAPDSDIQVSADTRVITAAERVVFPGVGAMGACMAEIRRLGFDQLLPNVLALGKPVLGICVGMQALLTHSEESGGVEGIDLLSGAVKFFGDDYRDGAGERLKVPHIGWNQVTQTLAHPLWQGIDNNSHFYFVHSYYVQAGDGQQVVGHCDYGKIFTAAMSADNLFATQFHPEKSHTAGLQLLKNFTRWQP
ncbi:MAG: imidazole glycerol phosphate synthase subunit HisH [Cellvibrionaceae bacterium]|nr:imidazole glycerol phosphate synthase subunit HisH [Cellvibrionaceae bacterium]